MRLFPPDPEITLYETGFGGNDPFDRASTGKSLSELVERIEEPLVIALEGGWGSGKTWFLKRWVGAHQHENNGRATTVYFDAYAHDFMDDPLVALTGVIVEKLPTTKKPNLDKIKRAVAKLSRPITRIGLAAATSGVTEIVGPVLQATTNASRKEIAAAAEAFWAREDGRREAMVQLRTALVGLTVAGGKKGDDPVPLVVVVDELDRCRPDYALALLEVIKHFFSVPNVHFVLGVSLEALGHSVRARYGPGIDAERYLRKFISISMSLPDEMNTHDAKPLVRVYFDEMAQAMKLDDNIIDTFGYHLDMPAGAHSLTMRDVNQILSRIALLNPSVFNRWPPAWRDILVSLILFRFVAPELERMALEGTLTLAKVRNFYGIKPQLLDEADTANYSDKASYLSEVWEYLITDGAQPTRERQEFVREFGRHSSGELRKTLRKLHMTHLYTFVLQNAEG